VSDEVVLTACAERRYRPYIERSRAEIRRMGELERRRIPDLDVSAIQGLRAEAAQALAKFRPATFGQAGRLEGVTPADLTLLSIHAKRVG
jgi:tRNA uridine 5-carboxymethylaminomethyl modification enzyme